MTFVTAIVPAAGTSSRMRGATADYGSKILFPLAGHPVLYWTLKALLSDSRVTKIIVAARADQLESLQPLREEFPLELVEGGATRTDSIRAALDLVVASSPHPNLVLIHDGARCLVSPTLVAATIDAGLRHGAVAAALPSTDTVARVDQDGAILSYPPREHIRRIQTPQAYTLSLLVEGYKRLQPGESLSDDSAVVGEISPVRTIAGEETNRKLTVPADLEYASLTLRRMTSPT